MRRGPTLWLVAGATAYANADPASNFKRAVLPRHSEPASDAKVSLYAEGGEAG